MTSHMSCMLVVEVQTLFSESMNAAARTSDPLIYVRDHWRKALELVRTHAGVVKWDVHALDLESGSKHSSQCKLSGPGFAVKQIFAT